MWAAGLLIVIFLTLLWRHVAPLLWRGVINNIDHVNNADHDDTSSTQSTQRTTTEIEEELAIQEDNLERPNATEEEEEEANTGDNRSRVTGTLNKLLIALGAVATAYVTNVPGGLLGMPEFLIRVSEKIFIDKATTIEDNYCIYRGHPFLLYSSIIPVANLIATLFTFFFTRWGKKSIAVGASMLILGSILMSWFPNVYVDIAGRIIVGFGVGLLNQVIPGLPSEIFSDDEKYCWSVLHQMFVAFGGTLATMDNLVASFYHDWGWRFSVAVIGILGVLLLGLSIRMIESLYFLVGQGKAEKAKHTLRVIRGVSDVEVEYREISDSIEDERQNNPFVKIFRSTNRPVVVITTTLTILGSFLGVEVVLYYGPYILQSLGFKSHAAYRALFALSLINSTSRGVGVYVIKHFGRKKTYLIVSATSIISQVLLYLIFHMIPNSHHHLAYQRGVIAGVLVVIYMVAYGMLPGPLDWLHSTYTKECAALGSKINTSINLFITILINQVLFDLLCALRERIFLLNAVNIFIFLSLILAFLPETNGIKQDEMYGRVWSKHWFWRHYVTNRPLQTASP